MQEDKILNHFVQWGNRLDNVRALILTSSRTTSLGTVDIFSDYDLILVTPDIQPFYSDRKWLEAFGMVLALFRDPIEVEAGFPQSGYIVQYEDGLKIDFALWQIEKLQHTVSQPELPAEFDAGYRVVLDKDNLTSSLKSPTYKAYIPTPPTPKRYQEAVETFFLDTTYVAKFLWRNDLMAIKHMLDHFIKQEHLLPMLEWHMEIAHQWSIKPGLYGRRLKHWLRPDLWAMLEATYTGADIEANWKALFQSIQLYRKVAIEVGEHLGYDYPHDLEKRTQTFLNKVKNLDSQADSLDF